MKTGSKTESRLRKDLVSGVLYIGMAKYTGVLFLFFVTLVLARLLSPEDFGVMALCMLIINFFSQITIMGISPAIVQNRELTEHDLSSIYSLTYYIAGLLGIVMWAASPLVAMIYRNDTLRGVIWLSIVCMFFSIVNTVPNALALRNKDFRFIAIRTVGVQVLTGGLAIVAAYYGGGVYSLLLSPVLGSILIFLATVKKYHVNWGWSCHWASIRKILSFSVFQVLFNICNMIYRGADKLLLGYFCELSVLGYYDKAYSLIQMPIENISNVITPVLHPVLVEYQNSPEYVYQSYMKLIRLAAFPAFALSGFLFGTSREVILILFGEKWSGSIIFLKIFSLIVGILIVQSLVGAIFQTKNKTSHLFFSSVAALLVTAALYSLLFIYRSPVGFAILSLVATYLIFGIYHFSLFRQVLHKPLRAFFLNISPAVAIMAALIALFWAVDRFYYIENIYLAMAVKIVLTLPFAGLVYSGVKKCLSTKLPSHLASIC